MLYPYFRSQWLLMPFHSELLKWYAVNQTAFNLGVWPQWRATKPGTEIHSSLKASVVSNHNLALVVSTRSFTRLALFLAFPHGRSFFLLTFLNFSSTNQNATLILKLEGPIRIPSDRTLELPPPGTQGFAGGGGCRVCVCKPSEGALWKCHRRQQSITAGKSEQSLSMDFC